ncbi:MAG: hypothetical protein EXR69_00605 [Myxococcales bacterium]|nr:hypothetical protein [Myxococcales bacterium]
MSAFLRMGRIPGGGILPILVAGGISVGQAAAAEPGWVQTVDVPDAHGPPDVACTKTGSTKSPGVSSTGTSATETTPIDVGAMGSFALDVASQQPQLTPEDRVRLQIGEVYDVARVPLEPLRGDATALARVHAVYDAMARRDRVVRVAFWGASHVAGEYYTGEVRRQLQAQFGDAGHGFVMPAAPWSGYRGSDVNLCTQGAWVSDYDRRTGGRGDGLLGVAGVSVESSATSSLGWVQTTKSNPQGQHVTRFEVQLLLQPAGGSVDLTVDDAAPVRVSTRGDTGPGMTVLRVLDGPHRLTVQPAGDGPVRLLGVNMEADGPGVVVDAMGVSGRTMSSWTRWSAPLQSAFLERRPPDLAVLAYGTNEANDPKLNPDTYRAELRVSLSRFREVLPGAACVLVGPSDRGKKLSGSNFAIWGPTAWVAKVQAEVALEFGCASWDMQAVTGGPGSMLRWRLLDPPWAAADLIHFMAAGYQEIGRRFVGAMAAV